MRYSLLRQPLLSTINNHLIDYPTPSNLNIGWNFGSLAGLCLMMQILTGIFLAMHYTAHVDLAFSSVQHIMRDVPSGWLLRYVHANGASLFFIVVYLHMFRSFYHSSYSQPRELVWLLGVVMLLFMILTAFIGYLHSQKCLDPMHSFDIFPFSLLTEKKKVAQPTSFLLEFSGFSIATDITLVVPGSAMTLQWPSGHKLIHWDSANVEGSCIVQEKLAHYGFKASKIYDNVHLRQVQLQIALENRNKAGIYMILNKINGKCYVGSAITNRMQVCFRNHFFHGSVGSVILNEAIQKYGAENFVFCVLQYHHGFVHHQDFKKAHLDLLSRETFYINCLNCEYNVLKIAGCTLGYKHNEETKLKIRLNYSQERREQIKNLNLGQKMEAAVSVKAKFRYMNMSTTQKLQIMNSHIINFATAKKPTILLDHNHKVLQEFESQAAAGKALGCSARTIRRMLYDKNRKGKKFRDYGYLRLKEV